MNTILRLLGENPQVSEYKINQRQKESFELFFVKGSLETVRRTSTCDKEVTVYVNHDGCKGDSLFMVYPSTTQEELKELIDTAVSKAMLISNPSYELPGKETGEFSVPSNLGSAPLNQLAKEIAQAVFAADTVENASLNSVEVFVNKYTDTIVNSRGLHKTQTRYDAMVEAIPTYNGQKQSVELYQQYNFSHFDPAVVTDEIHRNLLAAKARYEAVHPECIAPCKVILNKLELSELFWTIAGDLNFASVYAHANLHKKGDAIQQSPTGDSLDITLAGTLPGNIRSTCFDGDGMTLGSIQVVKDGAVQNYYGANRFGQYLGEVPTGNLRCLQVAPGSACQHCLTEGPYLEVISMSGLQVDLYNDYIGGEVRLAYYHDGEKITPVTGISITGSLKQVLGGIHLSKTVSVHDGYNGPDKAILADMKIF